MTNWNKIVPKCKFLVTKLDWKNNLTTNSKLKHVETLQPLTLYLMWAKHDCHISRDKIYQHTWRTQLTQGSQCIIGRFKHSSHFPSLLKSRWYFYSKTKRWSYMTAMKAKQVVAKQSQQAVPNLVFLKSGHPKSLPVVESKYGRFHHLAIYWFSSYKVAGVPRMTRTGASGELWLDEIHCKFCILIFLDSPFLCGPISGNLGKVPSLLWHLSFLLGTSSGTVYTSPNQEGPCTAGMTKLWVSFLLCYQHHYSLLHQSQWRRCQP